MIFRSTTSSRSLSCSSGGWILYGNVREFGDAGGSLGKRCLFFLTTIYPEIRLPGDRVNRRVKHLVFRGVRELAVSREFKDVVFEDVVFDHDSFVTIYCGKSYEYFW